MAKVVNFKSFCCFEYPQNENTKNIFSIGDVVVKPLDWNGNTCNEIGVVIQLHDDFELRTDMFGNECIDNIRLATIGEIKKYRNSLIEDLQQ